MAGLSFQQSRRLRPCGEIDDGLTYRHRQELEDANIHEDSKSGHTAARIAPFKIKCAEHMVIKGSIHCHDYDEDVFPCVHN